MKSPTFQIAPVRSADDIVAIADLFRAYVATLDIDLTYQNFEAELASLPGQYAAPTGQLLLARDIQNRPVGCVALRSLEAEICEMKRLYVAPEGRGLGLGKALVEAVIAEAQRLGYREMRLDTLDTLTTALAIYRNIGFQEIPAYYETPIPNTVFMSRPL